MYYLSLLKLIGNFKKNTLLACFVLLISICSAKNFKGPNGTIRLESKTFGKTEFVPLLDLADSLDFSVKWMYEPGKIELRNNKISVDLMVGSRLIQINKSDIRKLDSSLVFIKGEPFVPASFLTKSLKPYYKNLKSKKRFFSKKKGIVVIDPGHGGHDTGAIGYRGIKEKNLVLDIARRVRTILVKKGIKVRMTRDSDRFIDLVRRADIANNIGATVFVSIHANAVTRSKRSVNGSEIYYLSKAQTTSAKKTEKIENMGIKNIQRIR